MDDATLRARLQDLREGHTGDAQRGAEAFSEDARWRDQAGRGWIEGRQRIRQHLEDISRGEVAWDPSEVVLEGKVALVRCRMVRDGVAREGWIRLGLGQTHLTSWDAVWTDV